MSKSTYKRFNNSTFQSDVQLLGLNGLVYKRDSYFLIFCKNNLSFCWLFLADNFDKYLSLRGKCQLKIFCGGAKINGVGFKSPFEENIYSPSSHAKTTIAAAKDFTNLTLELGKCVESLTSNSNVSDDEKELLGLLLCAKDEFDNSCKWTAVRLETLSCIVSDDLVQFNDFRRIFDVDIDFPFAKKLKFSLTKTDAPSFNVTAEMSACIDELVLAREVSATGNLSVVIVGPKDSGKSGFMQAVVNRLFAEGCPFVYVLDGDPGQSQFSPSGCLSLTKVLRPLMGPPFTHQYSTNVNVMKQFFLGLLSPNNDPKLYCRTFESLYHSFREISSKNPAPLVINTMGWPQGLGLSLLVFKLILINPQYVIQFKKGRSEKELIDISHTSVERVLKEAHLLRNMEMNFNSVVRILNSPVATGQTSDFQLKPLQHRDLTTLAYLFQQTMHLPLCFPISSLPDDYKTNPVTRLRCRVPVFLKYTLGEGKSNDSLPLVRLRMVYSEVDEETQPSVIEDCFAIQWVAICRTYSPPKYTSLISNNCYTHRREEEPMFCVGMGFVSHVRKEVNEIDLMTGVDKSLLDGAYLVKGQVYAPDCLLLNQREVLNNIALPYVSPMITVGIGKTPISTRKSLPKIRRHHH